MLATLSSRRRRRHHHHHHYYHHRRFGVREYNNARQRCAGSRAAPQESSGSGRVSTFRFYSLVGRSAAPLRVKFVALRCARRRRRRRVRGALSRSVHHRAFDCASPRRAASRRRRSGLSIRLPACPPVCCSTCDTRSEKGAYFLFFFKENFVDQWASLFFSPPVFCHSCIFRFFFFFFSKKSAKCGRFFDDKRKKRTTERIDL